MLPVPTTTPGFYSLVFTGDNVLDFVIDGAKVTAVDLNQCQLALCSLKRAAILELNHADFFAIFAQQDIDLLRQ
jgi:S-adenosylmethionine:diacylglycerol 3-amino-3-carboxypropyl transferase